MSEYFVVWRGATVGLPDEDGPAAALGAQYGGD